MASTSKILMRYFSHTSLLEELGNVLRWLNMNEAQWQFQSHVFSVA